MFRLVGLTAVSVFTAEAMIMILLESLGTRLSVPARIFLDSTLLMVCVLPTLYFFVFKEMSSHIQRSREVEQQQSAWNKTLELKVAERTERLQNANEALLIEIQERARAAMALRTALNQTRQGKAQLNAILNAVNDALVVVDNDWIVLEVNRAAEIMFKVNGYDLQGTSLKNFLLPWSQGPADLDAFFARDEEERQTFLVPPDTEAQESWPVQMRYGAELEWNELPATVVTFFYRSDLTQTLDNKAPMS